jgi:hypothetical protein
MARKKAQRKPQKTLVPYRTPNLSVLLARAETVIQHKLSKLSLKLEELLCLLHKER